MQGPSIKVDGDSLQDKDQKEEELQRIKKMWKKAEADKLNRFAAYKWEQLKQKALKGKQLTQKAISAVQAARKKAAVSYRKKEMAKRSVGPLLQQQNIIKD